MAIHECFPYLRVRDAHAALAFYTEVFEATERFRLVDPGDGRIGHAELQLGPGMVLMLSAEYPEMGIHAPTGDTGMAIHLHVDDCDALIARAAAAGATVTMPPKDQFHGERSGKFRDPFGHEWYVGHSIEEGVSPEEMQRRWDAMA
ncbi:MAG: VOC family protein [Myxococcota bacterium]